MLISLPEIVKKYNLNIRGVIEVGAHWAEENQVFYQLGINNIVLIEPCIAAFEKISSWLYCHGCSHGVVNDKIKFIKRKMNDDRVITLFNCACADYEGEMIMYASNDNQGQSNSLLKPLLHLDQHPNVVFDKTERVNVVSLDSLPIDKELYNLLMMDVQGAEGLVLKGATETLKCIDIIYTEINRDMTYENNMLVEEMDEFLKPLNLFRVETFWPSPSWSWGDAIYLKSNLLL